MPVLLTLEQLKELKDIIEKHHTAFVAKVIGPGVLTEEEKKELEDEGLLEATENAIKDAYLYGQLVAKNAPAATQSYEQFQKEVKKNPIALTPEEEAAVQFAEHQAGNYIRHLGSKVVQDINGATLQADHELRAQLMAGVREKVAENIKKRESIQNLKSELGKLGEGWSRDWMRVAVTEKNWAMQQGIADHYKKTYGDPLVFKRTMPDACKHCKRLYDGPDGAPRIFRLSTLQANGTNVGVKAPDWKPVIGSTHPWCHPPWTKVITARGNVPIEEVQNGERVLTARGRWQRATRMTRLYEGELVVVATEHGMVEMTPNHPMLTSRGWVLAENLERGDRLVHVISDRISSAPVEAKPKNSPPTLIQERSFARILFLFSRRGVPVPAVDFNGELYIWKRKVDVEDIDRKTNLRSASPNAKSPEQLHFVLGPEGALICEGTPEFFLARLGPTPSDFVCGNSRELPFSEGEACIPHALRVPVASLRESSSAKPMDYGSSGDSQTFGYLLHGEQFVEVEPSDFVSVEGDAWATHTPIVDIGRRHIKMPVSNLSVEGDHSFFANGFASHNCQCQLSRVPEGFGFDEEGLLVPGGPYGILYGSEEDAAKAAQLEDELQKAFKIQSRINYRGLPIAIENPVGSVRSWTDKAGRKGSTTMKNAYGYIEGTLGPDGDEYDVFMGPDPRAPFVFVMHQNRENEDVWDEDKAMVGFSNVHQAKEAYLAHYDDPTFLGMISMVEFEEFVQKVMATTEPAQDGMVKSDGLEWKPIDPTFENRVVRGTDGGYVTAFIPKEVRTGKAAVEPPAKQWIAEKLAELDESERFVIHYPVENIRGVPNRGHSFELPEGFHHENPEAEGNKELLQLHADWRFEMGQVDPHKDVQKADFEYVIPFQKGPPSPKQGEGGPIYYGPKGGKYADPQHKIPWKPKKPKKTPVKAITKLKEVKQEDLKHKVVLKRLQPGQKVDAKINGEQVQGTFIGIDWQGRAVIQDTKGKRRIVAKGKGRYAKQGKMRATQGEPKLQPESSMKGKRLLEASPEMQKLMNEVKEVKVLPGHNAESYISWLEERGHEAFVVGGLVRDLVRGKSRGYPDSQIREAFKDVDIVTTAPMPAIKSMFQDHPVQNPKSELGLAPGGVNLDSERWGVLQAGGFKRGFKGDSEGLDMAMMLHSGDRGAPDEYAPDIKDVQSPVLYDHDLKADISSRDFTCNSLYYDLQNHVIIDPSGQGYEDAANSVLRLVNPEGLESNHNISMRFWKFRIRGYAPAGKATIQKMREHFELKAAGSHKWVAKEVKRAAGSAGLKNPHAFLASLRKVMEQDGTADLYDKHIAPIYKQLVQEMKYKAKKKGL